LKKTILKISYQNIYNGNFYFINYLTAQMSKLINLLRTIRKFNFKLFLKLFFIILKKDYSKYPKYVDEFENSLCKKFNIEYCLTFSSGTAAFYSSLLALNFKKKSKVLISSLTFPTVIEILKKFDFDIYFFNIDRNFEILDKNINDQKYDLLVMTYPFGFHINSEILGPYLDKDTKIIIDASHSQGMTIGNEDHIKFADVSFMSLQGNKSISGGEGGVILTNNQNLYLNMINNHHPGHKKNKKFEIAGGINDLKLRIHPLASLLALEDLKSFEKRNNKLIEKIKLIYNHLDKKNVKHPYQKHRIISGFHFGIPFFSSKDIVADEIKKYNWYTNLSDLNIKSISPDDNESFFKDLYFIDLEWIKRNKISKIENIIDKIFKDAY